MSARDSRKYAHYVTSKLVFFLYQKKYDAVVMDCTKALEYNNRYTKALFRRAKACEITNDLMQCLEGERERELTCQGDVKFCAVHPRVRTLTHELSCQQLQICICYFSFCSDVTAVCILESFENQQSLLMADRVLKELGKTKAKEAYKVSGQYDAPVPHSGV